MPCSHLCLPFLWVGRQLQEECIRPRNVTQTLVSAPWEQTVRGGLQEPSLARHLDSSPMRSGNAMLHSTLKSGKL